MLAENSKILDLELEWFTNFIKSREKTKIATLEDFDNLIEADIPSKLTSDGSYYADLVLKHEMNVIERVILLLALIPHVRPKLLNGFLAAATQGYLEFGGVKKNNHNHFMPTGETAAYILVGDCSELRFKLFEIFSNDHFFSKKNILKLDTDTKLGSLLNGEIILSKEYLSLLTTGKPYLPDYSSDFPAKRIDTDLNWEDLVLEPKILNDIKEIEAWMQHGETLMLDWDMSKKIKPGYRTMFYGPSGTGKTLCATLLGKALNMPVFRIDLSMVVSKYIGETEKNLKNVFDQAEHKNWILFFDEADALFGKRTQTKDAHDRYANQEVAYLLQRIEDYDGLVILATNMQHNIDDAFARRFQSKVEFSLPKKEQRKMLWENAFSPKCNIEYLNFDELAHDYDASGGMIINVVRYSSIEALRKNTNVIQMDDIYKGLRKEYRKSGKLWTKGVVTS